MKYIYTCRPITTIKTKNIIYHLLKFSCICFSVFPPLTPIITSQQLIHFLSLQICLHFLECYMNRVVWYVVWLISLGLIFLRFIHAFAHINNPFLFISEYYCTVWIYHYLLIHLLMDIFPQLLALPKVQSSNGHMLSFLLGKWPRGGSAEALL